MTAFISWYLLLTLLGWLTFPLAYRLFPALPDRGFTLARTAGLLIWGYIFWLFTSLGISQNDVGGILLALAIIIGVSIWSLTTQYPALVNWLGENLRLVLTTEILFLVAFVFLAFVRSANPELTSAEKPMELAFINAILRSPAFPPRDPWLSDYAISYYYFGYVMTAMLARLTSVSGSLAHNLMTALIFGLGAIGSYGIVYNLLALTRRQSETPVRRPPIGLPLLAPLFLLLVSNFEGLFEVLYRRRFLWSTDPATGASTGPFWKWLDLKEMTDAPQPLSGRLWESLRNWLGTDGLTGISNWVSEQFMPNRHYLWWWRGSRVIQDYDMRGNPLEVIDEFPFFSFLHADLHPHVLAIPFTLLAISVALNLLLGGWQGRINLWGFRLHINPVGFFFSALVLGGLAFLNTWDILISAALIVLAYVISRALADGWRWERLEDLLLLGLPLGITGILLYLPFYFGFTSQAGGILPSLMYPTRGAHLWVMWGPLFIPLFAMLIHLWRGENLSANWKLGFSLGLGFAFFMWIFMWGLGWIASFVEKDYVVNFLASQGMSAGAFFMDATLRRLSYIGGLVTLLGILIPALAFLINGKKQPDEDSEDTQSASPTQRASIHFVLILVSLAAILVITPDFVYLRDQFGYRINTIFKFYYQAWILWSLAAAFGIGFLLQRLRGASDVLFRTLIALVIILGLFYPAFSLPYKTNGFNPAFGYTLDDFDRVKRENQDEAEAIQWLMSAPDGVVAEAIGGSYSGYARVSTYSGMPTVLGWPGHEGQWRGGYEEQSGRSEDINVLYTTSNWDQADEIIQKYNIRYIYVGSLEQITMRVQEEKFKTHLNIVFENESVVIYEVP
jgi:YYY domain-containing protein